MKKTLTLFAAAVFIALSLNNISYADRKYFARSYLAYTLPQRAMELEIWNTMRIGKTEGYYYRMQPRFELEYGATDRLTTSLYMNFDQRTASDNGYFSPI